MKRTTISAEADDLRTLEDEARRQGVSLNAVIRQLVAEAANELRATRRPQGGVVRSGHPSVSQESVDDEDSPARG